MFVSLIERTFRTVSVRIFCLALGTVGLGIVGTAPLAAQTNVFPSTCDAGIGTTNPQAPLHITEPATPPTALFGSQNGLLFGSTSSTGFKWIQSYANDLALNPVGNDVAIGRSTASGRLDVDGTVRFRSNPFTNLRFSGASDDAFIDLTKSGATLPSARIEFEGYSSSSHHEGEIAFFTRRPSDSTIQERMRIRSNGDVNIPGALTAEGGVLRADANTVQLINPRFNTLRSLTRSHACINELGGGWFTIGNCLSDAEYTRAMDIGEGFPKTGDLVSLVPGEEATDGQTVFAVARTTKACDPTLIGFISEPEYGASGQKLGETYIPLAQTGFFNVQVTMENGPIRRGDPISSSSTAGAGMRSLGACRIVGYALEDADEDRVIKVIARLGDDAGVMVEDLAQRVAELESKLAKFEAGK
ncbi:MAG: hypothetical protein AAF560_18275 [Acidobacteriota bacterium]